MKSHIKTFWLMTLHIKLWLVQNLRFDKVLDLLKQMDLLESWKDLKYSTYFDLEKYYAIHKRIGYPIELKCGILHVFPYTDFA